MTYSLRVRTEVQSKEEFDPLAIGRVHLFRPSIAGFVLPSSNPILRSQDSSGTSTQ